MITLDVEQGTPEWFQGRLGIPTASNFDKLLTGTLKPSAQSVDYMHKLVVEWYRQVPEESFVSDWMKRGTDMEPEARSAYEFITDTEVHQTGLVYSDKRKLISCSPDGLLADRGLEIKCPSPAVHGGYIMSEKLPARYVAQVQGSMYVTGMKQWDFFSYHPEMPPYLITVNRDERFMKAIDKELEDFIDKMMLFRMQFTKTLK